MSGGVKKLLIGGMFVVAAGGTVAGIWFTRSLFFDGRNAKAQIGATQNLASGEEVEGGKEVSAAKPKDSSDIYYKLIKTRLLDVDLADLMLKNSDTVGWVQIMGTSVNYPYVQSTDNVYYTTHSFDKGYNPAGWVFLDTRNAEDLSDRHSILYLHGDIAGTEFEPIRSVIASSWLMRSEDWVIRTSTMEKNAVWQVFSIYKIEKTEDYLKTAFVNSEAFLELVEKVKERSVYRFDVPFSEDDKMLTFSIKYDDEFIVAIHAKLILSD